MVTALSLFRGASSSTPVDRDDKVSSLARWLAHQRAVPVHMVESTALLIAESASEREPLEGPGAPLVVQPRGALWLIGKLGGRALLHIFSDQESAEARGRELATEEGSALIVIGQGGEILSRWRPERTAPTPAPAPMAVSTPAMPVPLRAAPFVPASSGPAPSPAPRVEPSAPLATEASAPVAARPTGVSAEAPVDLPEIPLEVRRNNGGWAVMLRGRVIATAPTREKARLKKKALAADPDFVSNPQPVPPDALEAGV